MTAPNPERLRELLAAALDRAQRASRPHHDNGATSLDATVEYVNSFAEVRAQHAALLHQLAERDAEVERLRISLGREQHEHNRTKDALAGATETWYDAETGTTWDVPAAWAYAQSCRAREEQRNRAEAAERARDAMREQLRIESALLLAWARESREGGWSTHQVDPMKRRAEEIDAFLAASGGK